MNHLGKMLEEYYDQNLKFKGIRYVPQDSGGEKADMLSGADRIAKFNSQRFKKDIVGIIFKAGQS